MSGSPRQRWGVVLYAHGTVEEPSDLPAFVERIRRGRPAPPGLLEELTERYRIIGGSPLLEVTRAQARAVGEELGVPAVAAMRLWHPFLDEVLPELGPVDHICVVPLAPFSVHVYRAAAEAVLEGGKQRRSYAEPWGQEPAFVGAQVELIRRALDVDAEGWGDDEVAIILTAHSLPVVALRDGDPYQVQFEQCARAVEAELGRPCRIAYQSQGVDGGEWLGPTVELTLKQARDEGAKRVVVAPLGFLSEHIETLYDLDVLAAEHARVLGLSWTRVPALNTHPGLIRALCAVAQRAGVRAT